MVIFLLVVAAGILVWALILQKKNFALLAKIESQEELAQAKEGHMATLAQEFQNRFENLANKIFDNKTESFTKLSQSGLDAILKPFKEKVGDLQKKIEDNYNNESKERFALQGELKKMVEANKALTDEAHNLAKALKGDVKAQGNWGEIILEKVLESSGLRKGIEYTREGSGLGLKDDDGNRMKPDVIINLPDDKNLIVDSKVSLVHYEEYTRAQTEEQKRLAVNRFLNGVRAHITGLSGKSYHTLDKVNTPEFVLLFMPIEGAFSLSLQEDETLFAYAWEKSIVVVSPTTLLATLRTVASIWKQEHQAKNAQEIAKQGGLLYDRLQGFVSDLEKVGKQIKDADRTYDNAFKKLHTGRGNVLSTANKLREMGVKNSKLIAVDFDEEDEPII